MTRAPSSVALVRGPALVHAYAGFSGGTIFAAAVRTGTDEDCNVKEEARQGQKEIEGDRLEELSLAAGMVACLATRTGRTYELLWHARPSRHTPMPAPQSPVLMAGGAR